MKANDVLLKELNEGYEGYMLQKVYEYFDEPLGWESCKKLIRIPRKISYFLDKNKILEVRKTKFDDIYYMVKLVDNTYLELVY